jgi:hypothetical protein
MLDDGSACELVYNFLLLLFIHTPRTQILPSAYRNHLVDCYFPILLPGLHLDAQPVAIALSFEEMTECTSVGSEVPYSNTRHPQQELPPQQQ